MGAPGGRLSGKEYGMTLTFADVMLAIIAVCCIIFLVAGMDVV
jgi:hypothetical protein